MMYPHARAVIIISQRFQQDASEFHVFGSAVHGGVQLRRSSRTCSLKRHASLKRSLKAFNKNKNFGPALQIFLCLLLHAYICALSFLCVDTQMRNTQKHAPMQGPAAQPWPPPIMLLCGAIRAAVTGSLIGSLLATVAPETLAKNPTSPRPPSLACACTSFPQMHCILRVFARRRLQRQWLHPQAASLQACWQR